MMKMLQLMGETFLINLILKCKNKSKHQEDCYWSRGDYATGCLLDYLYCEENYKLIVINLNEQQGIEADPKTIH